MNQWSSTNKDGSDHGDMPDQHVELVAGDLEGFTYGELKYATRNFGNDTCLGDGHYAEVFKGWVNKTTYSPCKDDTVLPIAIKRLHHYKHLDLGMLKELSHPNLVKLLGYCLYREQLFLVYEFMPNGNFQDCLHSGIVARLPLATKVKIAVGIARGIIFLHETRDKVRDPHKRTLGESCYMPLPDDQDFMKRLPDHHHGVHNDVDDWLDRKRFLRFQQENDRSGTFSWLQTVRQSLDRQKILLDQDFTVKFSDYDVAKFVDNRYPEITLFVANNSYLGCEPVELQSNLSGFTVLLAEVLTGTQISCLKEFWKIDGFLHQWGKRSLRVIAELCFEMCNEVDSESKMLTILEEYDNCIRNM